MSTKIHIQFGDRKFDYEGEAPLARKALIEAFDRLHGGVTLEEHAEEFGSSFATQPESLISLSSEQLDERVSAATVSDTARNKAILDETNPEYRYVSPIRLYCVSHALLAERKLRTIPDSTVLTGAMNLTFQSDGRPFTRKHLSESLERSARTFDAPWPIRFGDRVVDRAIEHGLLVKIGNGYFNVAPDVKADIENRLNEF